MTATSPQEQHDRELYNAAIEYIERGWSVIPISPITKKPLIDWKVYQSRLPTHEEVDAWFAAWSGFNLAVATGALSGVVVVDADTPEAVAWCEANGLTSPFSVRTRRGRHYYFAHPRNGERFKNVAHNAVRGYGLYEIPHLDFRGDGGYVIIPPSISRNAEKGDHKYEWEPTYLDWDDCPVWRGKPSLKDVTDIPAGEFSFESLDLSGVGLPNPDDFLPVWDRMAKRVERLGRKFNDGDGRNNALTQYLGELVRQGVDDQEELLIAADAFQEAFFAEPLEQSEIEATARSVLTMDRANHPDDYEADGSRKKPKVETQPAPAPESAGVLRPVYPSDVEIIEAALRSRCFLIDPWMTRGSITMVYGWTGGGKSLFLQNVLWHAALGRSFANIYEITRPWKVLYFDFENGAATIASRVKTLTEAYGDPGQNFAIWAPSLIAPENGGDINLNTDEGKQRLAAWIAAVQPDIVVIDTIRTAFMGLEENDAAAWAPVNRLLLDLRNAGISVVVVHHANKPNEHGLGREAGSSNQLSNVETQMRVTQLFDNEAMAEERRGKCDVETVAKLRALAEAKASRTGSTARLLTAWEVPYGKLRSQTENHVTAKIGIAEDDDGRQFVVSNPSPRNGARGMWAAGRTVLEIANEWKVPSRTIRAWLGIGEAS
jgi:hypothetical protein